MTDITELTQRINYDWTLMTGIKLLTEMIGMIEIITEISGSAKIMTEETEITSAMI